MWNGNRLKVIVADVAPNTITIRSLDFDRSRFDIEFGLSDGTTYNSYLIFGADKTALIDASHEKFRNLYMPALKSELEARGRTLDYVFVSHTEPDHSGELLSQLRCSSELAKCTTQRVRAITLPFFIFYQH